MTNTATLNTSNKNTNNCGKLKYILRKNNYYCLKLCNIRTQQSNTISGREIDYTLFLNGKDISTKADSQKKEKKTERNTKTMTVKNKQKNVAAVLGERERETESENFKIILH